MNETNTLVIIARVALTSYCTTITHKIDSNFVIKVADFGLSESVYTKTYFRETGGSRVKLPVKWMSQESLNDGVFTEKSDVVCVCLCACVCACACACMCVCVCVHACVHVRVFWDMRLKIYMVFFLTNLHLT